MPARSSERRQAVARVAINTRHGGADSPQALEARRDLAEATLREQIKASLASAPDIGDARRKRLAALLWSGSSARVERKR